MFYVYFLQSLNNNDLYVGSTENLERRLYLHNAGRVKSTKFYKPWKLFGYETYKSRSESVKRERFLKTGQQKELIKRKYGLVAK